MTSETDNFEKKFLKLKTDYVAQLPKKLAAIHDDWIALKARHSVETLSVLHRNVHSLVGTSGTFGFAALSQSARSLEVTLKPLLQHSTQNFSFNTELAASISSQIQHLFTLLDLIQQKLQSENQDPAKLHQ